MRVAWFPKAEELAGNPYWPLLQSHLEQLDVRFETSHNGAWLARRWLIEHRKSVQVLHFHFIQSHYAAETTAKAVRRLAKFASDLLLARGLGYRVVWTVHELTPTWPMQPAWLDKAGNIIICACASRVITHCERAREMVRAQCGRRAGIDVIPHAGYLPPPFSRFEARALLGIPPGQTIIAFIGGIRPNKGIEQLLRAYRALAPQNARLLIAGRPWPPDSYVEAIKEEARGIGNVEVHARVLTDRELMLYAAAASVVVLPFREVLTSGSAILAQSCGSPVVVPDIGCLRESIAPDAAFFYEPDSADGLTGALKTALSADLEAAGYAGQEFALSRTWGAMAAATLAVYEGR